jgi:hypothetical protein
LAGDFKTDFMAGYIIKEVVCEKRQKLGAVLKTEVLGQPQL